VLFTDAANSYLVRQLGGALGIVHMETSMQLEDVILRRVKLYGVVTYVKYVHLNKICT
jgi:hypothetical protein